MLYIGTDIRMHLDPDGQIRTRHNAISYPRWQELTQTFGQVTIVGRVSTTEISNEGVLVTGPNVFVHSLPQYSGLLGLVTVLPALVRDFASIGTRHDLYYGRLPEVVSSLLILFAFLRRAQYVANVVSDAQQHYSAIIGGPIGHFVGWWAYLFTRWLVRRARGVVYVTESWLQNRYPARKGIRTLYLSNVTLELDDLRASPRIMHAGSRTPRLISVGAMGMNNKGFDVLICAVKKLLDQGIVVGLTLVGDGAIRPRLELQAAQLELSDAVHFAGHVESQESVLRLLDDADLYVSASRVEGLPRSVVEAMARALPVVATRAGGTEELLLPDVMVARDDPSQLASHISRILSDKKVYERHSRYNLEKAREIIQRARSLSVADYLQSVKNSN